VSIDIALCISSKWSDIDFTERLRRTVPHNNYYTGTYTDCDLTSDFKMDEPNPDYHCVLDTEPYADLESCKRRELFVSADHDTLLGSYATKSIHWNKQILLHNHMMKNIPKCDIVIRSRFDAIVSEEIDWNFHIQQSYEEQIPIGFNTINISKKQGNLYNELNRMPKSSVYYINDALIIHPYDLWDCDLVDELYENKKLKGAEEGWYQVLSEPSNHYHRSYVGGVYLDCYWKNTIDAERSLHTKNN